MRNTVSSAWSAIKPVTSSVWDRIKNAIMNPLEADKNFVKNIIDTIKGFFNFCISWAHIPMPHFGISPHGWKVGDLLKCEIPKLAIDGQAKYQKLIKTPLISGSMNFKV